jgi:hypothetical protein
MKFFNLPQSNCGSWKTVYEYYLSSYFAYNKLCGRCF